jgi:hypothetical protein
MKRYTIGGETYLAEGPEDFLSQVRASAFDPEETAEAFAEGFASRSAAMTGHRVRPRPADQLVHDLVESGLLVIEVAPS